MQRVGLFTEVFHPIVNGVVASIDSLRVALHHEDVDVVTFAPFFPDAPAEGDVVRFPSLPLPTSSGYRLCIPHLPNRDRERARTLDVVHAHSPFASGWFAAAHARRIGVPLIYTYHTQFDAYAHYAPFERRLTRSAMIALTRAFAHRADVVVAPTHAMRERLRSFGVRARIEVIPSSIDVDRFRHARRSAAVRASLAHPGARKLVLVVARLAREKNVELAIDALAYCARDVHLAIVGDGVQRNALEARVRRSHLSDRVTFAGALPPAALPGVYASCDAFAFTSRTDTQGLVLVEATAAGLPIVAVDDPVARETADHATFAPHRPDLFAAAITAVVERDAVPTSASNLERFVPSIQAKALIEVYRSAQSAVRLALDEGIITATGD